MEVRRFFRILAFVGLLFVIVDVGAGLLLDGLFRRLPLRDNIPSTILHRHVDQPEVVLIGSSRCHHHYVSNILADSLGSIMGHQVTLYNFGLDGVYVNSSLCAIESMLERYTPQMVILDANSHEFDQVYSNTVAIASPLYWSDRTVRSYINSSRWSNRIAMLSSLYRYRGAMPLRLLQSKITPADTLVGFSPLFGAIDTLRQYPVGPTVEEFVPDSFVMQNFKRVASLCSSKGVLFVVVDSPRYRPADNSLFVSRLCQSCQVPFVDLYQTPYFDSHPELFYEPAHLNATGAELFTELLCHHLAEIMEHSR